ncbi:MAG: PAS domain S-box protein [Magnetococcales bacterium]|nr:PAS domain S-box protein [Magnetococcales bacterium]
MTPVFLIAILVPISKYNYLLYHSLSEFLAISIALLMGVVVWQTFQFSKNHFLMYLGCGYLWIGLLDLFHLLSFPGLHIFPELSKPPNLSSQLWLAARYLEALLLFSAPLFLSRKVIRLGAVSAYGVLALLLLYLIFTGLFPDTFVSGYGLTPFKIWSEYLIMLLLAVAMVWLLLRRSLIDPLILLLTLTSIALTISAELAFTLYTSPYGTANLIGHLLKISSFWLIARAIIHTTLTSPYRTMARNSSTYNAIPQPIVVVDHNGIIQIANPAVQKLTGLSESELQGMECHSLLHPKNISRESCLVCQSITDGQPLTDELLFYPAQECWWSVNLSPVQESEGIQGMVHQALDVTKRLSYETISANNQLRLQLLMELNREAQELTEKELCNSSLEIAVTITKSEVGYLHLVSENQEDITLVSWSKKTLENCHVEGHDMHYPVVSAGIWADSLRQQQPVIHNDYPNQHDKRGLPQGHFPLKRHMSVPGMDQKKVGMILGVGNKATPYDQNDVNQLQLLANDILTILMRHRAENSLSLAKHKLETLIDSISDALVVVDIKRLITGINQGFTDLFGYELDDVKGKSTSIFYESKSEFDRQGKLRYNLSVAESFKPYIVKYKKKDGTIFPGETLGRKIQTTDGNTLGFYGLIRDVSERLVKEDQLRRSQKMDAILQLTGGISHDFNNILSIIIGNAELLKLQEVKGNKKYGYIEAIEQSSKRAIDLTKQLLSFSLPQAYNTSIININSVIKAKENLIARSITPQIEVYQHLAEDLWSTKINIGDFEDALLNLILNARDAMHGNGQLSIETVNCTLDNAYCSINPGVKPGNYVQLVVSDTGDGIPHEIQEHIFEPFFTTKPKGKGTGLGLAQVFGFIKRTEGHIKVYSEAKISAGTSIRLYLPKSDIGNHEDEIKEDIEKTVPSGSETVLVVDDEEGLVKLAQESLQSLGYKVLTAGGGREALEQLSMEPNIALLFSDVVMPGGLNGYELANQAVSDRPDLKVMLTSGYTEKTIAKNGLARFNANLLAKPYNQSEMAKRIRGLLDEQVSLNNPPSQDHELTLNDFSDLPKQTISNLYKAAVAGDFESLMMTINKLSQTHSKLSNKLEKLVDDFQFKKITDLLENFQK